MAVLRRTFQSVYSNHLQENSFSIEFFTIYYISLKRLITWCYRKPLIIILLYFYHATITREVFPVIFLDSSKTVVWLNGTLIRPWMDRIMFLNLTLCCIINTLQLSTANSNTMPTVVRTPAQRDEPYFRSGRLCQLCCLWFSV